LIKSLRIRVDHALGYAIVIAQIDEQDTAMIANAMAPAGKTYRFADVRFARLAAAMGTIAVHYVVTSTRGLGRGLVACVTRAENRMGGGICQDGDVMAGRSGQNAREPIAGGPPLHY
jgi:hypothetical protein